MFKLGLTMITKSRFNLQILSIPFSIISISLVSVCYFLLQFVDLIVHGDLYGYGLVFSYEWANQYWNYSTLLRDSILFSILILVTVVILIIIQILTNKNLIKSVISILIGISIFFIFFSLFSLIRLDFIVNNSLYDYGLQFSYEWTQPYWNNIVLIFGLCLAAILINAVSILFFLSNDSWFLKGAKSLLRITSLLFFAGISILFLSINFNSSILAFIGLGLVFWGAILLFIRSNRYVKEDLLLTATKSSLLTLRQFILELGYKGKGIYLPPKYLRDYDSSKVFITKTSKSILPLITQIQDSNNLIVKDPEGILLTPPGYDLSLLFEKTLGTHFIQKDLAFIEINLRRLIVDDLEIAQNIEMKITEELVQVTIEDSVYKNMGTLSSAIACVLAKTSGKLVIITNREISKNSKIITLSYTLIESPIS